MAFTWLLHLLLDIAASILKLPSAPDTKGSYGRTPKGLQSSTVSSTQRMERRFTIEGPQLSTFPESNSFFDHEKCRRGRYDRQQDK